MGPERVAPENTLYRLIIREGVDCFNEAGACRSGKYGHAVPVRRALRWLQ